MTERVGTLVLNPRGTINASEYMPEIAGLRVFALGLVVVGHLIQRFERFYGDGAAIPPALKFIVVFLGDPAHGVLLFFTISGFLIATKFLSSDFFGDLRANMNKYFVRRAKRIVLPYFLVVLLTYLFIRVTGFHVTHVNLFDVPPKSLEESLLATLLFSHMLAFGTFPRLFPPGWTLELEVQFYLVMPAIMFLYLKFNRARMWLGLNLLVLVASSALALAATTVANPRLNYSLAAILPYLWLGIVLANFRIVYRDALMTVKSPLFTVGMVLLCLIFILTGTLYEYTALYLGLKLCVIAMSLVCLLCADQTLQNLCRSRLISGLDSLSYPIYLTHLQVSQVATAIMFYAIPKISWPLMFGIFLLVQIPLVVGTGYGLRMCLIELGVFVEKRFEA